MMNLYETVMSIHRSLVFFGPILITITGGAAQEPPPCPSNATGVVPVGSKCAPVCWRESSGPGGLLIDQRVTNRSHLPSSSFSLGRTEVIYRYDTPDNENSECRFNVTVTEQCISGSMDAITQTSDGDTYVFRGDSVMKLKADRSGIADGYPKPICAVFPGLPSDLDAAVLWPNGETYFFKGTSFWRSIGTSVKPNSRPIATNFPGIPPDVRPDAVIVWRPKNQAYFFQGDRYWRYDLGYGVVNLFAGEVRSGWTGIGTPVDAAFEWSDERTYFFSGEDYWKFNDEEDEAEAGYPLQTAHDWFGCSNIQEDRSSTHFVNIESVCTPDACAEETVPSCLTGDLDAITHIITDGEIGNIFFFRGRMVARLTEAAGDIDSGFPRPICSVFPGLPSHLDAALTWKETGKTYFFKGDDCYRFTGYQLDPGYPRKIRTEFPGIPSDVDAAVEADDEGTFFFKGTMFFKFDRDLGTVAPGYPQTIRDVLDGLPTNIQAALQWVNNWTYFFKGEQYFRWDFERSRVAQGYPRQVTQTWYGCRPQSERNTCWIRQCS